MASFRLFVDSNTGVDIDPEILKLAQKELSVNNIATPQHSPSIGGQASLLG